MKKRGKKARKKTKFLHQKLNEKAQAAMEFLMTYGWAILIVLAVTALLLFLGVFDPKITTRCIIGAPFICKDLVFREKGFEMSVVAANINLGNVTNATVTSASVAGQLCKINSNGKPNGQAGSELRNGVNTIRCYGINITEKNKVKGEITISYTTGYSQLTHEIKGQTGGNVERSSYINNFDDTSVVSFSFDNDNSNTAIDNSYYGNSGTVNGATLNNTDCISGSCYSFDGVDDFIYIVNSSYLNLSNQITLEAWFKPTSTQTGNHRIISKWYSTSGSYLLGYRDMNPEFEFVGQDLLLKNVRDNSSMVVGTWYHIVGTYDGQVSKLYVNGNLKGQLSYSGGINTNTYPVIIGALSWVTIPQYDYINGVADNVRVYNRALTPEEITGHYNNK